MKTKKTFRGATAVVMSVAFALVLFVPYVFIVCRAHEKNAEQELVFLTGRFSDVTGMGRQHFLNGLMEMAERADDAGKMLSVISDDNESARSIFSSINFNADTDAFLVYSGEGTLLYGSSEYASLFLGTAREAQASGKSAVSNFIECSDGIERLGLASPFRAQDGSTQTSVLLFNRQSLESALDNLNLSEAGVLGIIDENGAPVLCQPDRAWFRSGRFSIGETGDLKDKLLTLTRVEDGKEFTAYAKPLGINNWLLLYGLPKEEIGLKSGADFEIIYIHGGTAILLLIAMIGTCVYRADLGSRRLELYKKKFRIATRQSARAAYEYDRRPDRLVLISESEHVKLPKPYISLMELGDYVHPADRPIYYQSVVELRSLGTTSVTLRLFNFCGREVYRWYHVTGTRLTDRGEGKALTIGTVEDIDEQENERQILLEKATTDSLTGLWNRLETEKEVNKHLLKLGANEHSAFALLDLDDFKEINDKYGHDCGDRALVRFAEKLRSSFKFGDILGRLGGDEFVVHMTLTADRETAERRLGELMENIIGDSAGCECNAPAISCSIGCCMACKEDTFESVYKRADDALYKSKSRGKMQFTIVD